MTGLIVRLGLHDLAARWRLVAAMSLVAALPFLSFLILDGYRAGLESLYSDYDKDLLVVQSSGSMGEFYGSRLPANLGEDLAGLGLSWVVPEIHTIIGSSPANAILLRGIPLDTYTLVEEFRLVDGRPLQPGDPARAAMIGIRLAEKLSITSGDTIALRGHPFQIVGVFSMGTYADYEAWAALPDAQWLLSWGDDVSVYVIPAGESLRPGDLLPGGASIVQKGTSSVNLQNEWAPFIGLLKQLTAALGLAGAVALANLLWRLAWQRRRELAILRSLGFRRRSLSFYLFVQAAVITLLGYLSGLAGAVVLSRVTDARTAGITLRAVFDQKVWITSLAFALVIVIAGSALPALQMTGLNLATLLRDE